jgi:hypothetical protein
MLERKSGVELLQIEDPGIEAFSLHNEVYNETRTHGDWIWEYKTCYPSLSVFTIVKDKGRIVGTQGMLPIYLNVGGKRHLTGKSESSLLEKTYRGGTLFQDLYSYAMAICKTRGMCCVWGFTTAASVWRNKLDFSVYDKVVHTYALSLTPSLPSEIKRQRRTRLAHAALSIAASIIYLYCLIRRTFFNPRRNIAPDKFVIEEKIRNLSDLDGLYERLRSRHREMIYIEQDARYIAWRITDNPNIKYRTYFLFEGELLRAYCYLSMDKDNVARLTDFTSENKTSGAVLLDYVIDVLSTQKVGFAFFMGNIANPLTRDLVRVLKRAGFLRLPMSETNFVLRNISCEASLNDVSNWYVNGLWTEGYQW